MLRAVGLFVVIALAVYAVFDCLQTAPRQVQYLPKALWLVLVVIVPVLGPAGWFYAGRRRPSPNGPQGRRPPAAPRGPEDDPDFLRNL